VDTHQPAGPPFGFTARPWSDHALHAAQHAADLVADTQLHLSLDVAQHGIRSGAAGPGVIEKYRLHPHRISVTMTIIVGCVCADW
jgi:beta-galactosidase